MPKVLMTERGKEISSLIQRLNTIKNMKKETND